jgi:hypothetical protein
VNGSIAQLFTAEATSSVVATPAASVSNRDFTAAATSSVVLTPSVTAVAIHVRSETTQIVVRPRATVPVDAALFMHLTPTASAVALLHAGGLATSVLTPSAAVDVIGPKPVSAATSVTVTPAGDEQYFRAVFGDATAAIVLAGDATELRTQRFPVDGAAALVVTATADSGVDRPEAAADSFVVVAAGSVELEPAPPRDRTGDAEGRPAFLVGPAADAVIVRDRFAELGRFRRGDRVVLDVTLPAVPDGPPVAVVLTPDSQVMGAYFLPIADGTHIRFALPLRVDRRYGLGTYRVSYQFQVGGEPGAVRDAEFSVIPGGDPGGEVIALYAVDRPEARLVLAHLDSGRLVVGRNPSIGDS